MLLGFLVGGLGRRGEEMGINSVLPMWMDQWGAAWSVLTARSTLSTCGHVGLTRMLAVVTFETASQPKNQDFS